MADMYFCPETAVVRRAKVFGSVCSRFWCPTFLGACVLGNVTRGTHLLGTLKTAIAALKTRSGFALVLFWNGKVPRRDQVCLDGLGSVK